MKLKKEDRLCEEPSNEDSLADKLKVTEVLGNAATATKQRNEKIAATTATVVSWAVEEIKKHIETQADLTHNYDIAISQPDSGLNCCEQRVRAEPSRVLGETGWKVTDLNVTKEHAGPRLSHSKGWS
ncbi:hypothetical protein HDU88_004866 [Geranomyces variabilis]|nr:hypothetical protein HDU88_004866 [Geranomyces variabilis]